MLDVRKDLKDIRDAIHDSRFVYLLALKDGAVVFLADSEPVALPTTRHPARPMTKQRTPSGRCLRRRPPRPKDL